MLTDYMECYEALTPAHQADGLGGTARTWTARGEFRGALTHAPGIIADAGGRPVPRLTPTLLHEAAAALVPGEQVRRKRDGSLWRVTSASADACAPACSPLALAAVTLERLVIP